MADRDTTGTPYKLSADGICYFRHPDGDAPVVMVADYAELRTKGSADAGYLNQLFVSGTYIAGNFEWQADDPYGNGDDGGLVIAANDGWWVRVVGTTINMDWYEIADYGDITVALQQISDNSHFRDMDILVPQRVQNTYIDQVTITTKRHVRFRGNPGNRHTMWQSNMFAYDDSFEFANGPENDPTGQPGIGDCRSLILANADSISLDKGVHFYGRDDCQAYLRFHNTQAIIEVTCGTRLQTAYFGCDIDSPIRGCIQFADGSDANRPAVVTLAGVFDGGEVGGSGNAFAKLIFDNCEINDKHGISLGRDRNNPTAQGSTQKFRGGGYHYGLACRTEGVMTMRWGQRLGGATAGGRDGTDVVCHLYDLGYTEADPNGTQLVFYDQVGIGKWDGFANYQEDPPGTIIRNNQCKYVYNWHNKAKVHEGTVYESTPDSAGETKYVANFDLTFNCIGAEPEEFIGISMKADTLGIDVEGGIEGRIFKNVFSGNAVRIALGDGPTLVRDLEIHSQTFNSHITCVGQHEGWPDDRVPVDVEFTDVTIRDSAVYDHADQNSFNVLLRHGNPITFTRLKTTKLPPTKPTIVIGMYNGSGRDQTNAPCIVHMNEHQLHPGTRAVASANRDPNQEVRFFVDGVEVVDFLTNGWTAP